mgnify:CR=1 FL=1
MKLYKTYAKYYDSIYYEQWGKWYEKQVKIEEDIHELGIYSINEIKKIMAKIGFKTEVSLEKSIKGNISTKRPYFVGVKNNS